MHPSLWNISARPAVDHKKGDEGKMIRQRKKFLSAGLMLMLAAALLCLISCSVKKASHDSAYPSKPPAEEDYEAGRGDADYQESESPGSAGESAARYRIRTGSLELTVLSTREMVEQVRQIAADAGGYISDSYVYTVKEELYHANLTLRVPENRFDAVMKQLRGLGKFSNERTGDEDVTMPYLDLEARLKTLEAQEVRLRELLGKAETVEDILNVERELQRVRQEIESLSAQFKHLQDQVRFSTITVGLREEKIATTAVTMAPFVHLGARIKEGLMRSTNFVLAALAGILVVLVALLPVAVILIPAALVLRWIINRFRRRHRIPPPADGQ